MLGNFGISGDGSGIVISGDALMGYDGGYRAWCGKSPLVWIGPPYRDAGSAGTGG